MTEILEKSGDFTFTDLTFIHLQHEHKVVAKDLCAY